MNIFNLALKAKNLLAITLFLISTTNIYSTDTIDPSAVCVSFTSITLDNTGYALVYAVTFDNGSTDNSGCINGFKARRMDQTSAIFTNAVTFDCNDIGNPLQVVFRVFDCAGNYSDCMVTVTVEDKSDPFISCPATFSTDCSDLSAIYNSTEATATDACSSVTLSHYDYTDISECGSGYIDRTWIATDAYGNSSSCVQQILLVNNETPTVTFFDPTPPTFVGCGGSSFDQPTVNGNICSLVAVEHDDQVFQIVPNACYKIIRTWKVIDWCVFELDNPNNNPSGIHISGYEYSLGSDGYMEYVQILKFLDEVPPELSFVADSIYCNYSDVCGNMQIDIPVEMNDDCTENDLLELHYNLYKSIDSNWVSILQNIQGEYSGLLGNGQYKIDYFLSDKCGNLVWEWDTFEVKDCKNPTPYCIEPTIVACPHYGFVELWATDFDYGSYDNCTDSAFLSFKLVNTNGLGTAIPATESMDGFQGWMFDICDQVENGGPVFEFELHVTDEAGNTEYCTLEINISNLDGDCESVPNISGQIISAYSQLGQTEVTALVNSETESLLTENNVFLFTDLPIGANIELSFEYLSDIDYSVINLEDVGVIEDYILDELPIEGRFEQLSADMNNNGTITGADAVLLRRIILGFDDAISQLGINYLVDGSQEVNIEELLQDQFIEIEAYLPGDILVSDSPEYQEEIVALLTYTNDNTIGIKLNEKYNIDGLQFTMEFDASVDIDFDIIESLSTNNFNLTNIDNGFITFLGTNLTKGQSLFEFTLDDLTSDFVNSLVLSSRKTNSLGKASGIIFKPTLFKNEVKNSTSEVLPNPFDDEIKLMISDVFLKESIISIYNVVGMLIHEEKIINTSVISLGSKWLSGVYFIRLNNDMSEETIKIVKN